MKQSKHLQRARTRKAEALQIGYRTVAELELGSANSRHREPWPAPAKVEPRSALPKLAFLETPFNSSAAPRRANGTRFVSHGCVR